MQIKDQLKGIQEIHGEWTAHNIKLTDNISTMEEGAGERYIHRAEVYKSLIHLGLKKRISRLRILDLGCLEGGISIELAKEGAFCTGIDIRDAHLKKARFAAETLRLKNKCHWIRGDVTDSSLLEGLPKYDVIILSGLLYHLDINDILPLLKRLKSISKKKSQLIVDTNITSSCLESGTLSDNLTVWGRTWREHGVEDSLKENFKAWSSYSNNNAFWLREKLGKCPCISRIYVCL